MKKALVVFGTRPEAIKMAPVVAELRNMFNGLVRVCVTAQHREMLDQVLKLFQIVPDYDLDIMKSGQDLSDITSSVLIGMREVLDDFQPDVVLVHGDTTTTFTVSLAAYYKKISVAHVEAGLRTGNIYSPWPEEVNRKLCASICAYHFSPTNSSRTNLLSEGVNPKDIYVTGNTVVDALLGTVRIIDDSKVIKSQLDNQFKFLNVSKRLILITAHRRENFGSGFGKICSAISTLAERDDLEFIFPVHPNPNVQNPVREHLSGKANIHLVDPLDYLPFVYLMRRSYLIITDSGGIQEEAPSLGKPVLVIRNETERPEAVDAGTVRLVGTHIRTIIDEVTKLLENNDEYDQMAHAHNPYGDGCAARRIVSILNTSLN